MQLPRDNTTMNSSNQNALLKLANELIEIIQYSQENIMSNNQKRKKFELNLDEDESQSQENSFVFLKKKKKRKLRLKKSFEIADTDGEDNEIFYEEENKNKVKKGEKDKTTIIKDVKKHVNEVMKRIKHIAINLMKFYNDNEEYLKKIPLRKENKKGYKEIINNQEINYVNGKYIGQVVNGLAEGKGIFYNNNGDRYEGYFLNDKPEGKGIMYF